MDAKKGDWVRIHKVILRPDQRGANLPEDTKQVAFEMWDKGFLKVDGASLGDEVTVETVVGRKLTGTLVEVAPNFDVSYGEGVTETLYIGKQLREILGEVQDG